MNNSHHSTNHYFVKTAGLLSIFSGIILTGILFYAIIVLNSLGLTFKIFEERPSFIGWLEKNHVAYSILWIQYAFSAIIMLPVPNASSHVLHHSGSRSSSLIKITHIIGSCGFLIVLASSIFLYASSPVIARSHASDMQHSVLLIEIFESLGLNFRLTGELMIGIWLLGLAAYRIKKNRVDNFGWFLVFSFLCIVVITTAKAVGFFDFEPVLMVILAATYIWVGISIRKKVS
ncbi:MAG: hypothetical protein H6627_11220 [Calditrichae bacterium]|nr:hypothetical protein [Calditrichota bacterium]MCB9059127.1 hypothetical protein [Calditrichia bacterium]